MANRSEETLYPGRCMDGNQVGEKYTPHNLSLGKHKLKPLDTTGYLLELQKSNRHYQILARGWKNRNSH